MVSIAIYSHNVPVILVNGELLLEMHHYVISIK